MDTVAAIGGFFDDLAEEDDLVVPLFDGDANTRETLQISTDNMATWKSVPLSFSSNPDSVTVPNGSGVSISSSTNNGNNTWTVSFQFEAAANIYTKIGAEAGPFAVDPTLTQETTNLLKNIHRLGWNPDQIAFGQEFPLSFSRNNNWITPDLTNSDSKDIVGDHPGVHGSDFHFMIDKSAQEIAAHKQAALNAYDAGAIVTFDYHWQGRYGQGQTYNAQDAQLLINVINDDNTNGDVTWFYEHVDAVLDIINNDLQFPIVFRPFHEMNGNWFWWGSLLPGGAESYRAIYKKLFNYMAPKTEYVLWCWSPDKALATNYYPGDEYVDIIGVDGYGEGNVRWFTVPTMISLLESVVDFAEAHGKVAAFTETGHDTISIITYHDSNPKWWTENVLTPILASEKARKIAWILTWINTDNWSGPYIPYTASPQASKDDFKAFYDHNVTLFEKEVAALNVYDTPPSN